MPPPVVLPPLSDDVSQTSVMSTGHDSVRSTNQNAKSCLGGKGGGATQNFSRGRQGGKSGSSFPSALPGVLRLPALRQSVPNFPDHHSNNNSPTASDPLIGRTTFRHSMPDLDALLRKPIPLKSYDDDMIQRLVSLPGAVCRKANGDVVIVELAGVAKKIHKQRLGKLGLKILRNFEASAHNAWERNLEYEASGFEEEDSWHSVLRKTGKKSELIDDYGHGKHSKPGVLAEDESFYEEGDKRRLVRARASRADLQKGKSFKVGGGRPKTGSRPLPVSDMRLVIQAAEDAPLTEDIRARVNSTMGFIEGRRQELKDTKANQLRELEIALEKEKLQMKKYIDFVALVLTPRLMLDMSRARAVHAGPKKKAQAVSPEDSGSPFLSNWERETLSLEKSNEPMEVGWNRMFMDSSDIYAKGGDDTQGAAAFKLECHSLGIPPSSQVMQALQMRHSNMAHSKLGRFGASALCRALAANTVIESLNLEGSGLCALSIKSIVEGLCSESVARLAAAGNPHNPSVSTSKADHISIGLNLPTSSNKEKPLNFVPKSLRPVPPAAHAEDEVGGQSSPRRAPGAGAGAATGAGAGADKSPLTGRSMQNSKSFSAPGSASGPSSSVRILDLSDNSFGLKGAKSVADLLDPGVYRNQLRDLRLVNCGIPDEGGVALGKALLHGNYTLSKLNVSNNTLGWRSAAVFGELFANNTSLTFLDLSWNMIKADGVKSICHGLIDNESLATLNLSWNGMEDEGGVELGGALKHNKGLKHLDLSNTRLGPAAALVLSDGLRINDNLEVLLLNGNLVCDDGARHLMAALKINSSIKYLGLQGTNLSTVSHDHGCISHFNPLCPEGSYILDLANARERAVAQQLCTLDAASDHCLMRNIKLDGRHVKTCKEAEWPAQLPEKGVLLVDYVPARERRVLEVIPPKKLAAMQTQFDSESMSDKEKLSIIQLLTPFSLFSCRQSSALLNMFAIGGDKVTAAVLLFSRAADLDTGYEEILGALSGCDVHAFHQQLGWYTSTRFSNPTGHYEFSLSSTEHRQLASRLKDVAYEEPEPATNCNWINIVFDMSLSTLKVPGNYGPPPGWKEDIPSSGSLSFDFVSGVAPPEDAEASTDGELTTYLKNVVGVEFDEFEIPAPSNSFDVGDRQISALRQSAICSSRRYYTCDQVLYFVNCFKASPHRVEVVLILFALTVDRSTAMWLILRGLSAIEQALVTWRLGPERTFDPGHTTGHYIFDLSLPVHEQVIRRLFDSHPADHELPTVYNLRVGGRFRVASGANIMGLITAETFTPFVELDYIGKDAFEFAMDKSSEEISSYSLAEKSVMVNRLAMRMELNRIRDVHAYYEDGSCYPRQSWQGKEMMMSPFASKQPWLSAWDRQMRILIRFEEQGQNISSQSHVMDVFKEHSNPYGQVDREAFETACKKWGTSRGELVQHYLSLFEENATEREQPTPKVSTSGVLTSRTPKVSTSGVVRHSSSGVPPVAPEPSATFSATAPDTNVESASKDPQETNPSPPAPTTLRGSHMKSSFARSEHGSLRTMSGSSVGVESKAVLDFKGFVAAFLPMPPRSLRFQDAKGLRLNSNPKM